MIILAPLQGYTDYVFRNAYGRHFGGIDLAIAPFVSLVKGKKVKLTHLRDLLPENNGSMKIIPQVMGNDPEMFLTMAESLKELGYDSMNWNLGCPVQAIARKKRGSGLLPFPDEIDEILSKVLPRIDLKFSIKTRLGYETVEDIFDLMEVYNSFPLDFLAIHPRIGKQMYEGDIHYEKFEYCLEISNNPVVYSGDIWTKEIFDDLFSKYLLVDAFMLGRGLFRDLFLAEKIAEEFVQEKAHEKFWNFQFDLLESLTKHMIREKNVLNKMKEYWSMWAEMFENPADILERIYPVNDVQKLDKVLRKINGDFQLRFL
ncbi:MAG: tRNA-dihydrouridine synthase family protein [Bacteroidota bacterium]|nr:tRNA-dihydrouridine synthase family protein [Bacteroidota bacterium]